PSTAVSTMPRSGTASVEMTVGTDSRRRSQWISLLSHSGRPAAALVSRSEMAVTLLSMRRDGSSETIVPDSGRDEGAAGYVRFPLRRRFGQPDLMRLDRLTPRTRLGFFGFPRRTLGTGIVKPARRRGFSGRLVARGEAGSIGSIGLGACGLLDRFSYVVRRGTTTPRVAAPVVAADPALSRRSACRRARLAAVCATDLDVDVIYREAL